MCFSPNFTVLQFEFVDGFSKRRRFAADFLVHVDRAYAAGFMAEDIWVFVIPFIELGIPSEHEARVWQEDV